MVEWDVRPYAPLSLCRPSTTASRSEKVQALYDHAQLLNDENEKWFYETYVTGDLARACKPPI